ncbi:MAG: (2Fe-2S)-binding protein [Proteobacteria bacterium]|nr:(2Fe-2S)-binding protein [Pseudomonadota bacterium]
MPDMVNVTLNGAATALPAAAGDTLLEALRAAGLRSVKHGCETGDCGACAVLVDGVARTTCVMLAEQARDRAITTLESLGCADGLHPLQEAFVETGAIQCGYCTPAMVMAACELLAQKPQPTEADVCDALSGTLCRCTGYVKPVAAVLQAAEKMRAQEVSK